MTVAVAGLGVAFHGCEGADALAARLRGGQSAGPLERNEGEAACSVLMRVLGAAAREAIADARLASPGGLMVLIDPGDGFLEVDAAEVAGTLRWAGKARSAFDVAEGLERAFGAIEAGEAGAALLLAAGVAVEPPGASGDFSIALEAASAAPPRSEGAAAVLLVEERRHPRGRARLGSIARGSEAGARGLAAALAAALDAASNGASNGAGLALVDGRRGAMIAEATALGRSLREGPRRVALASARAWLGDAGAASDLAGIAAAALCLERGVRPVLPGWDAPGPAVLGAADGLFVQGEPAFWPATAGAPRRRALVLLGTVVASLEAGPARAPASATALCPGRPALIPLAVADRTGIEDGLAGIEAALDAGEHVPRIARGAMDRARTDVPLRLAIVAADARDLRREVGFMRRALDKADAGKPVRTPNGSVLAPRPLGPRGSVAFVYPGNGSAYVGLGREITLAFAGHLAAVEPAFDHRLTELMGMDHIQPLGLARPTEAEREGFERRLNRDPAVLPLVGVAFSILHTQLLRDLLGVRPDIAMGYSVGECAMRAALGQWPDWRALERMLRHPALLEGVSGPMNAVRRFWAARGSAVGEPVWASHYVRAGAEAVAPHLGAEVFVQSVLSPGETILCGAPRACEAALARIGAPSLPLEFDMAVHAPPTRAIRAELEALCDLPVTPKPGTIFLSAHGPGPVPQTREATARTLAAMLTEPVDFRALVERAHADGARVFVEVGVRNACTGWIGATLGGREHLAVAMDVKGLPGDAAWMRAVAQLWAHRVPLDLGGLLDGAAAPMPMEAHA